MLVQLELAMLEKWCVYLTVSFTKSSILLAVIFEIAIYVQQSTTKRSRDAQILPKSRGLQVKIQQVIHKCTKIQFRLNTDSYYKRLLTAMLTYRSKPTNIEANSIPWPIPCCSVCRTLPQISFWQMNQHMESYVDGRIQCVLLNV